MRLRLVVVGASILWLSSAAFATTAEFYSWIDPSGTMVMTDDPTRIPPATARSPISIHHFEQLPPSAVSRQPAYQPSVESDAIEARPAEAERSAPPESSPETVLLEAPPNSMSSQYFWVPLLAPVYIGANQVTGFWAHRSVSSPIDAFKRFLGQHPWRRQRVMIGGGQLQLNNVFQRPARSVPSSTGTVRFPATPIFDQVMQERQQLIDRAGRPPVESSRPAGSSAGTSGAGARQHGHLR